jgi:hypothetical protein
MVEKERKKTEIGKLYLYNNNINALIKKVRINSLCF